MRPSAAVSTVPRRKQPSARGNRSFKSDRWIAGSPNGGSPCGTSPSTFTPRLPRSIVEATRIPAITTNNATGLFLRNFLPRSKRTNALIPSNSDAEFVSPRCEKKCPERSQKSPCDPLNPNSFGNCVLAINRAIPHLKPISTLSEMKFTITPALASHAMKAITPTISAVHDARAQNREASPPARSPSDAPTNTEIADVTVIAVCRELQNNQKTSPENKQAYSPASGGRLASEASASPAGMRYAARVIPATKSARSHLG